LQKRKVLSLEWKSEGVMDESVELVDSANLIIPVLAFVFVSHKYFWWGWFAPPPPGAIALLCPSP